MSEPDPNYIYLHNPYNFDERFEELTREHDTYEEAYHAVEAEFKKAFGHTKYSNYDSYRMARYRRIKEKQKT